VKLFCFEVKCNEVSYGEVLGDNSTMYVLGDLILKVLEFIVTISFGVCRVLWLFYLVF
jgi:hypothetical protein